MVFAEEQVETVDTIGPTPSPDLVRELCRTLFEGPPPETHPDLITVADKKVLPYRAVNDMGAYVKNGQGKGEDGPRLATAALAIDVGNQAYLVWFRNVSSAIFESAWSRGDLDDAMSLAQFVSEVVLLATGETVSNEVLVRVHEQRMRSRDEVHSMEHQLTSILASAQAPIFSVDKNKRIVLWNDEMERLTDIKKSAACGRVISAFMPVKDDAVLSRAIRSLMHDRGSDRPALEQFEVHFYCKKGNNSGGFGEPLRNPDETVELMLDANISNLSSDRALFASTITFVGQDVSAAKKVLRACQAVAEEHERMISECGIPVFFVDSDAAITGWNDTMAKITGIRRGAALGLQVADELFGNKLVLTKGSLSAVCQQLREQHAKVMAGAHQPYVELSFKSKAVERGEVSLFLYAGARRSEDGIVGVMYFAQDVTSRQKAEQLSQEQVRP